MRKYALSFLLLALGFLGCGYKPSTTYTTPLLGEEISTQVDIDIQNPTESIFLKDALNESVLSVFNAKVNQNAKTKIRLVVNSSSVSVLDYDKNGYPILYRASSAITAYVRDINDSLNIYKGYGSYDFSLVKDSVLSDNLRNNAIKESFLRALQEIEFKMAQKGLEDDNKGN